MRMLFVNSGILGHAAVAGLFVDVVRRIPGLDATHINLSDDLTLAERAIRPLVIARKISGGTRSERGSNTRMALHTLFAT